MRDTMRTRLRFGAVLVAATMAVALGGCAGGEDLAGDLVEGSASTGQDPAPEPDTVDPPGDDTPDSDPEESSLAGLDHDAVLAIGLAGDATITCGYTFDPVELEEMSMLSTSGWVTPEATIHLHGTSAHWEIPQEEGRPSHVLLYEDTNYFWKVPGDGAGVLADAAEEDSFSVLAGRVQANGHDCVAFTGPPSMFEVPADIEFERFEVPPVG